jgi:uncharacterized membrane protein
MRTVLAAVGLCATMSVAMAQGVTGPERLPTRTAPEPAEWRGVRVCNKSNDNVEVAKAAVTEERDDAGNRYVLSEGWFRINAGECRILWPGEIKLRYYYVYAAALPPGKGDWAGGYWACVSKEPFTIRVSECHGGYNRRKFAQIDTGDVTELFTFTLNP